jgi:hypothetical protein
MSYPTHGSDLAKSAKSLTGRRPRPGDHLHRIREVTTRLTHPHRICRLGLRRKRQVTPAHHETSPIELLPRLTVTCTSNPKESQT